MRTLILLAAWCSTMGCSTMTLRTGMFVVEGHPAFQTSVELGLSAMGDHHGVTGTHEYGVQTDGDRAKGVIAVNVDTFALDPDRGPVMRGGVRFRGEISSQDKVLHDDVAALMFRGAAYSGFLRDAKTKSGGFGIEIAGGVTTVPTVKPAVEANLVVTGRWSVWR